MNLLEIETRVRNVLDELDVDNSHWSSTRLRRFTNEGQDDLVARAPAPLLPHLWKQDLRHLSSGIDLYLLPSGYCKTVALRLYSKEATIYGRDMVAALETNPLYIPTTSQPAAVIPYQEGKVRIFPMPTTLVANGFDHTHLRLPTTLANDTDVPELPNHTHQWLVEYDLYRALYEDGDARAADFLKIYLSHLGGGQ